MDEQSLQVLLNCEKRRLTDWDLGELDSVFFAIWQFSSIFLDPSRRIDDQCRGSCLPQNFESQSQFSIPNKITSRHVTTMILAARVEFLFCQVHGEVCLKKHVCRLVANNKYRETPKFERSRNVELSVLAYGFFGNFHAAFPKVKMPCWLVSFF